MKLSRSFSKRLSLRVLSRVIPLVIFTIVTLGIVTYKTVEHDADTIASTLLDGSVKDIDNYFSLVENSAIGNIWTIKEHLDDPEYMYRVTWRLLESSKDIIGSTVAYIPDYFPEKGKWYAPYTYKESNSGEMISIQMGGENYDYHSMEWYAVPMKTGMNCWSEPYFDEGGGEQLMTTFSMPIWNEEKVRIAVFTADISLRDLADKVSGIKPYKNSFAVITDKDGYFIYHPDSTSIMKRNILNNALESGNKKAIKAAKNMVEGGKGNVKLYSIHGERYFMSYAPLANGWREAIFSSYDDVFGLSRRLLILFFILASACLFLLYFSIKKVIAKESQPITELTYAVLNLAQCKFDARIPEVRTEDELGKLHNSMVYLETSINRYIKELKASTSAKERFESELGVASSIQTAMLPHVFPTGGGLDCHAILKPAKEVGGDFYDIYRNGNELFFVIGDVSGKGVPAALLMAICRAAFRFISKMNLPMDEVVSRLNNSVSDGNELGLFVTLFAGKINLDTLEMEYCNAGHNPIVLITPDAKASFLWAKCNIAAGLFESFAYQKESIQLHRGERLLLYTDGVTEAERGDQEQYGDRRLLDFASRMNPSSESAAFCSDLSDDLAEFTAGAEQNDDITIMSIFLN